MARPLFRKFVFPWYYAKGVQAVILILGLALMAFAVMGVVVTREQEAWRGFIWVPALLFLAAAALTVLAGLRLKRAASQKTSKFLDFGY